MGEWVWLAQQSASPSPIELLQYGVLGAVLLALIAGWLWAKPAVDRLLEDKERLLKDRVDRTDQLLNEMRELTREVHALNERLGRLERERGRGREGAS